MKKVFSLLRTTIVGGILFLAPFAILMIVFGKVHRLAMSIVTPLAERLAFQSIVGFKTPWILATLLLLAVCFAAGMIARTPTARNVLNWLETAVLSNMPGYSFMKSVGEDVAGIKPSDQHQSILVRMDDGYLFGFLVERLASGHAVVFMPGAPKPWEGDVMIVEEDRVTLISDSSAEAVTCLRRLGNGAGLLLEGKLG